MSTLTEGRIRFDFGARWHVEKWDACAVYTAGIGKLSGALTDGRGAVRAEGTKAVDFVGILDGEKLYLIEVKDFRGHRVENKKRQLAELPLEIGLKARDTLAGLAAAYVKKTGAVEWIERFGHVLASRKHQVHVVAWIADDAPRPTEPRGKRAAYDSARRAQIQKKLTWLTPRVLVEDPFGETMPDVIVGNLPESGR